MYNNTSLDFWHLYSDVTVWAVAEYFSACRSWGFSKHILLDIKAILRAGTDILDGANSRYEWSSCRPVAIFHMPDAKTIKEFNKKRTIATCCVLAGNGNRHCMVDCVKHTESSWTCCVYSLRLGTLCWVLSKSACCSLLCKSGRLDAASSAACPVFAYTKLDATDVQEQTWQWDLEREVKQEVNHVSVIQTEGLLENRRGTDECQPAELTGRKEINERLTLRVDKDRL